MVQLINQKDLKNLGLIKPAQVEDKGRDFTAQIVEIIQNVTIDAENVNIDPVKDLLFLKNCRMKWMKKMLRKYHQK